MATNCINANNCTCACGTPGKRSGCRTGAHCSHHSNGCHLGCTAPPKPSRGKQRAQPRERGGDGRFRKRGTF